MNYKLCLAGLAMAVTAVLGIVQSSQASFVKEDGTRIDPMTYEQGAKSWFNHDPNRVYIYPKKGDLVLEARDVKVTIPALGKPTSYRIASYRDGTTDNRIYTVLAEAGSPVSLSETSKERAKLDPYMTRGYVYHFDRDKMKWFKMEDSNNYYNPLEGAQVIFEEPEAFTRYNLGMSFWKWGIRYEYELYWDAKKHWMTYRDIGLVETDFN